MFAQMPTPSSQTPSNASLVRDCLRGDQHAWIQLVDRYSRLVHSVPVRYGLSPQVVDDVGQDVFLALARHLHQVEDPEALPAWLITTARRLSWRAAQKQNREATLETVELSGSILGETEPLVGLTAPSISDLLRGWGHQEILAAGLARLQERCRHLLTLIFLDRDEPSYDDIASRLDLPKGSIGPTRSRCLGKLRDILAGLGFGADDI